MVGLFGFVRAQVPTRHLHPEGYLVSPSAQRLPRLRRTALSEA